LGFALVQAELEAQLGAALAELIFWQVLIQRQGVKDGDNWEIYALANPLKYVDPTGLDPWWVFTSEFQSGVQAVSDAGNAANSFKEGLIKGEFSSDSSGAAGAGKFISNLTPLGSGRDAFANLLQGKPGEAGMNALGAVPGFGVLAKAEKGGKITSDFLKTSAKELEKARRKAVREAWKDEKSLVRETGDGTRQWTDAEKEQLLKKGKVDDYEGHHINNVKDHPEAAGDPNNIEFLKKPDHLDAHDGNFKNETTGPLKDRTVPTESK